MKTAPQLIARRTIGPSKPGTRFSTSKLNSLDPAVAVAKARYVGALSNTDEKTPVLQKNCHGCVRPRFGPWTAKNWSGGTIVIKIPANRIATSTIGVQVKPFAVRSARGVNQSDKAAMI